MIIVVGVALVVAGVVFGAHNALFYGVVVGLLAGSIGVVAGGYAIYMGATEMAESTALVEASVVGKDEQRQTVTIETDFGTTEIDAAEVYLTLANAEVGDRLLVSETTSKLFKDEASYSDFVILEDESETLEEDSDAPSPASFCRSCGEGLEDGFSFCPICGTKIK